MPSTHHLPLDVPAPDAAPLRDAFAAVRDPRCRRGRRFTVAALLANHRSPFAIAAWGAEQDAASKRAMGLPKG